MVGIDESTQKTKILLYYTAAGPRPAGGNRAMFLPIH